MEPFDPVRERQLALDQLARLHGETEGYLYTLRRELGELKESLDAGRPTRPWSLGHYPGAVVDAFNERVAKIQALENAGLA